MQLNGFPVSIWNYPKIYFNEVLSITKIFYMQFNCLLSLFFNQNAHKDAFSSTIKVPQDKVTIKCVQADSCKPDRRKLNLLRSKKERRVPVRVRKSSVCDRWVNGHFWSQLEPAGTCNLLCRQLSVIRSFTRNTVTAFQGCFKL